MSAACILFKKIDKLNTSSMKVLWIPSRLFQNCSIREFWVIGVRVDCEMQKK